MAARRSPRSLAVVVLAAGKGKRMRSERPKVLHEICGRPSLWHVLRAAQAVRPAALTVVVSHAADQVREAVEGWDPKPAPAFVDQGRPLGTGHAVTAAEVSVGAADDVLVLAGDDPLVTAEHLRDLLRVHRRTRAAATILTTTVEDPSGWGRVIRDGTEFVRIVEDADASAGERRIREISTLVYAFRREDLYRALPLVGRENRQREYYLPDVLSILKDKGERVSAVPADFGGTLGLNSRQGLSEVGRVMRRRIVEHHLARGVTFVDPDTAYVDVGVRIGRDTVVQPFTVLEGDTRIGPGCVVGPGSRIVDSQVGRDAEVAYSVVRESRIGPRATVGPYASVRPGTVMGADSKAGTFVELKASRLGRGAKVPHLAYMGDATIGAEANIGAGSITCNYDGVRKHPTHIGDHAFIGSDTMLVAPVRIGRRAVTGAGSTITRDVPAGALAVERSEQRVVQRYAQRRKGRRRRMEGERGR